MIASAPRSVLFACSLAAGVFVASDCGCRPGSRTRPHTTPVTGPQALPRAVYVGTNVAAPTYGSRNIPFANLMRHADRTWISGTREEWNDGRVIEVDEHGWIRSLQPGQIARTFLIAGDDPGHLSGQLTVLYEGRGEIEYVGRVSNLRRSEGRDEFELATPDGLYIEITRLDPQDPIRHIRVFAPGGSCVEDPTQQCDESNPCRERCILYSEGERRFHADFLAELRPFSVLRFMDWQLTNRLQDVDDSQEGGVVRELGDLPDASDAFWQPVPVSVMVDLANQMDADPWFNVPHTASDDFVRELGQLVHRELDRERNVYIEYSNEVWNAIFDQHHWMNRRGCETYARDPRAECWTDGELCGAGAWNTARERCRRYGAQYFAERTAEICRLFRAAFEPSDRVVCVLGAQIGMGEAWVEEQLKHEVRGRPLHESIDAVAVAPYFGGEAEHIDDLDELFARTRRDDVPEDLFELLSGTADAEHGGVFHWIRTDLAALRTLPNGSVRYVAYEGGQHLHSFDENRMRMFHAANRDPRMERVYARYLRMWNELTGGALFVHYTTSSVWGRYGAFGAMERQGADIATAPKRRALEAFASGR